MEKEIAYIYGNAVGQKDGETITHMNYLYQLAFAIYSSSKKLSQCYISELKNIAKRHVIRLYKSYMRH